MKTQGGSSFIAHVAEGEGRGVARELRCGAGNFRLRTLLYGGRNRRSHPCFDLSAATATILSASWKAMQCSKSLGIYTSAALLAATTAYGLPGN